MREILFRGKRVDGYGWVFGDLIHDEAENNRPRINIGRDYSTGTFYSGKAPRVIPATVGQFTGLTDKNGKKIFEGDIIKSITLDTNTEQLAVVGFGKFIDENNDDEYLGFYIEFDGFRTTITQLEMEEVKDRFEVIGNIHDNPELLRSENEQK